MNLALLPELKAFENGGSLDVRKNFFQYMFLLIVLNQTVTFTSFKVENILTHNQINYVWFFPLTIVLFAFVGLYM